VRRSPHGQPARCGRRKVRRPGGPRTLGSKGPHRRDPPGVPLAVVASRRDWPGRRRSRPSRRRTRARFTGPFGWGSLRRLLGLTAGSSVILDNDVMGRPRARGAAQPGLVRVHLRTAGDRCLGGDGSIESDGRRPA